MPKLQCIDLSSRMHCSAALFILLWRPSARIRVAHVKEQAFHRAGERDDRAQQLRVVFKRAGVELRIVDDLNEWDQGNGPRRRSTGSHVNAEDFLLVKPSDSTMYFVGVGVDDFLEGLAKQVLAAFRHRDMAVGAQHGIVGSQ